MTAPAKPCGWVPSIDIRQQRSLKSAAPGTISLETSGLRKFGTYFFKRLFLLDYFTGFGGFRGIMEQPPQPPGGRPGADAFSGKRVL
jgi:hypothetical protein